MMKLRKMGPILSNYTLAHLESLSRFPTLLAVASPSNHFQGTLTGTFNKGR